MEYKLQYKYTVLFEPAEEGGYTAHVPILNNLTTEGETLEEANLMVKDAIKGYLEILKAKKLPIPKEQKGKKPVIKQLAVSI